MIIYIAHLYENKIEVKQVENITRCFYTINGTRIAKKSNGVVAFNTQQEAIDAIIEHLDERIDRLENKIEEERKDKNNFLQTLKPKE